MPSNPPLVIALVITEITAGLSKGLFGHSDNKHRLLAHRILVCLLLLVELGANITVGIWTLARFSKCGSLTRICFITTLVADVSMWTAEGWIAFQVLTMPPPCDFIRGMVTHSTCWMGGLVGILTTIPFGIASIRSFLQQPLEECSATSDVDSWLILGYACVCTYNILGWVIVGRRPLLLACSLLSVLTFTNALGIWGALQPERQVLVHGLLIVVPPTMTLLVNWAKLAFLTKDNDSEMRSFVETVMSGRESLKMVWSSIRGG